MQPRGNPPRPITSKGNTMTNSNQNTPAAASIGDNSDKLRADLASKLRSLGASEGKGSASRPEAAMRLVDAAFDGLIDERDAPGMFAEYTSGVANAASKNPLVTSQGNDAEQASAKQQISKFRQFIKCGMLPAIDTRDTMARAARICKDLDATDAKTYSRFDALLNVARAQVAEPETLLSDEQITAAVMKPEPAEKDAIAKLIAAYKAASKLAETIPMPQTQAAADDYREAILEAGGEVPPITKEEKEQAAFMKKAAMMGFVQGPRLIAAQ